MHAMTYTIHNVIIYITSYQKKNTLYFKKYNTVHLKLANELNLQ